MINVLSIGNSFSQDAHRYLHQIARADKFDMNAVNLYIGGCPLSEHYRNVLSEKRAYELGMNGHITDFFVSLKEALLNRNWDVVTIQQVSHESHLYETYQPYLDKVVEYVRMCVPKAKIAIHQTWAYEQDSNRLTKELGYVHHTDMFKDIEKSYQKAFDDINADILIPSGELLEKLIENGIEKVHRDTFHLHRGIGRYAVGLLWYAVLTGNSVMNNTFNDFDMEITKEEIEIAKKCVSEICHK